MDTYQSTLVIRPILGIEQNVPYNGVNLIHIKSLIEEFKGGPTKAVFERESIVSCILMSSSTGFYLSFLHGDFIQNVFNHFDIHSALGPFRSLTIII